MTSPLSPLQRDWLDALAIVRRVIDSHDIQPIFDEVGLGVNYAPHSGKAAQQDNRRLLIHQQFADIPRIERLEVLCYSALAIDYNARYPGDAFVASRESFMHLCFRVGCCHKNTASIPERWRLLDYYQSWNQTPLAPFEEGRPKCGICSGFVATGSGSWINSETPPADLAYQQFQQIGSQHNPAALVNRPTEPGFNWYRADLHHECKIFAHRVLAPIMRAQRQKQIAAQIAERQKDSPFPAPGE